MSASRARGRRGWGPSRHLLIALAIVTLASAGSLTWLGWEMLRQDAAVEAQRAQERLDYQADLAVQSLERTLAATEDRLSDWAGREPGPPPDPATGGLVVTFSAAAIETSASSHLLFYPDVPTRSEPPSDLFAEAERAEFQQRAPARAVEMYRRLAESRDRSVRAAALMRLGRARRTAQQFDDALSAYDEMAALGDVPVIGWPAELVARSGRVRVLRERGQIDGAKSESDALAKDLATGRWKLTRGQYEHYADVVSGETAGPSFSSGASGMSSHAVDVATAVAATEMWDAWKAGLPPNGRRAIHPSDIPLLASWRGAQDRVAVWIASPDHLLRSLTTEPAVSIALSAGDGSTVAGSLDGSRRTAIRTPTETRLPWTVHAQIATDGAPRSGLTRGRLVVLGLGTMTMFLVASLYFIGRAVKQEMDLSQSQSDFVSAVSHEFRTPLAAMRQLSELLAADRVVSPDRRQHYYESLAGESRRLQRLVENLLNFGRMKAGARPYQLEPTSLGPLVESVVAEFRSGLANPNCQIDVRGGNEPLQVLVDRDAIGLALHNLLDNAVKYAGASGPIVVSWMKDGDRVALSVQDRGRGIPPSERERIFERFYRGAAANGHVRGTGIGLAMVQEVARSHGGDVRLDSEPGRGSTFTILLKDSSSKTLST